MRVSNMQISTAVKMFETQEVTISHLSQFSHHNHILVPRLGAVLLGGHHVAVQRDNRLAVPAVCRVLLELLTDSEQQFGPYCVCACLIVFPLSSNSN